MKVGKPIEDSFHRLFSSSVRDSVRSSVRDSVRSQTDEEVNDLNESIEGLWDRLKTCEKARDKAHTELELLRSNNKK